MTKLMLSTFSFLLLFSSQYSHADINVSFYESAPKDSFVLKNTSECVLEDLVFNVDLSKTAGRLIFDTTSSGAGVEVFQPFEVVNGSLTLVSSAKVNDGDTSLTIKIKRIAPKDSVSFTIDVDDTLPKSALGNIRVADAEIAGGAVSITLANKKSFAATINNDANAVVKLPPCGS